MQIETCEICNKTFIAGYGYSIGANWLVTGHAHVRAFICPQKASGQHWGCTPEHAMQALLNCLREHMHIDILLDKHREQEAKGNHRYAEEDATWASSKDIDTFHIVKIEMGS